LVNEFKNIAIQGIKGSFHDEASRDFFGENIKFQYCDTFEQVFQQIKEKNHTGLVAIENSLAGSILPNYGSIQSYKLNIIGEIYKEINQQLMVLPDVEFKDIQEIWSHPMALRQCQDFINQNPDIKSVEKEDTAKSAYLIKKNSLKNTAAIASETAAKIYGMKILNKRIQANKENFTRFLILSKEKVVAETPNKASICFSVKNTSGSLAKVLTFFAVNQMNLTKIQSHPKLGKKWEYFFHVDLLFNDYNSYLKVIDQMSIYVNELCVLGTYRNGITNGI
jgi:prephenate dehydratase